MGQDLRVRLGGLVCLGLGAPAAWFFIMRPLGQARAGVPEVELHGKVAFVLVPLLLVFGLAFALGGERARYRDVTTHPPEAGASRVGADGAQPGGGGRVLLVDERPAHRARLPLLIRHVAGNISNQRVRSRFDGSVPRTKSRSFGLPSPCHSADLAWPASG